jgi:hypothetical protein
LRTATLLILLTGCNGNAYQPIIHWDTGSEMTPAEETAARTPHALRYEWAAGWCEAVQIPENSVLQLLDCIQGEDGVVRCHPDEEDRVQLIGSTAVVDCQEDESGWDRYRLTVLSVY